MRFPERDVESLLAARVRKMAPNPITTMMVRAATLKREGHAVLDFSVGEPDFDTPGHIQDAAIAAMRAGQTRYTTTDGTPELKAAIVRKFARENGLTVKASEITVGNGGKHVISNFLHATLEPGDEVIIPAPYWTTYPEVVLLHQGTPVIVPTTRADGFTLTPESLERAITPKTKWLILNSPSNPTGGVYSSGQLQAIAQVLLDAPHMLTLVDDMYEHFLYDGREFRTLLQVEPRLAGRVVTLNGASKTYAMTGWRIGYAAAPEPLVRAISRIQSQSSSNPCSISQAAVVGALDGPQDFLAEWRATYQRRRDILVAGIRAIPGLACDPPGGAFYLYVDCAGVIGKRAPDGTMIDSDTRFAAWLLEAAKVAVVTGAAFGLSPFIRLSYAASQRDITEACQRMKAACASLN